MICTVTVSEINGQTRKFEIASFEDLIAFFDEICADFLTQLEEAPYGPAPRDEATGDIVGGIGVRCENLFGSEIEVGIGREWWLFIDLTTGGGRFISDSQPPNHDFIFYLHGSHHTGFAAQDVIARDKCLRSIELWLEGHSLNSVTANIR